MEYSAVFHSLIPGISPNMSQTASNASTIDHTHHAKAVEGILTLFGLRGLAPVYGFVGSWLGLEPSGLLATIGVLWALNKVARQVYYFMNRIITEYFMSSIHIPSNDDIYIHLMTWLATQPGMINARALVAETARRRAWEDEDASNVARDRSGRYLNFSNQEARAPPQYSPAVGLHSFWWKGQYFRLQRKRESIFDDNSASGQVFRDQEDLIISCFWRSPEPIKQLLAHAKGQYYRDHRARTVIKRPSNPASRRFAGRGWHQVANRPVRDIRTVVLDEHQKLQVLADINEYLHPETPRWYANRGIPLRRGYCFHGPPGTGKTSLSFALAGIFGLDIHVISLLEPSLTEEDLNALFASLPRRCIVLLEDIDTAGLRRPSLPPDTPNAVEEDAQPPTTTDNATADTTTTNPSKPNKTSKSNTTGPRDWKVSDLARALKKEGESEQQKAGISLSGLLNAIDGVASHEGRILILTSNAPEQLDAALLRPGRVDLQVAFTNATPAQARELFLRMYEGDRAEGGGGEGETSRVGIAEREAVGDVGSSEEMLGSLELPLSSQTHTPLSSSSSSITNSTDSTNTTADLDISLSDLPAVAAAFGAKIPDGAFSPAEIQGYLLKRKKQPRRALAEADAWVEALVRQKALRAKVVRVQ